MEAFSIEDKGEGTCYNVYVYNNQLDIEIYYLTGDSNLADDHIASNSGNKTKKEETKEDNYILNVNTHKFHLPDCSIIRDIKESNKESFTGKSKD